MTTPLVTLAEVRSFMAIRADVDMPDVDARITSQIMLATMQLETALSMQFDYASRTEYFTPSASRRFTYDFSSAGVSELGLTAAPLAQSCWLTAVNVDPVVPPQVWYDPELEYTDNTLIDVDCGAYIIDYERGKLTYRIMARRRENALKITYSGGFPIDTATGTLTTSAPLDLKMACIIQTVFLFSRMQPDNIGMQTDRSQGKLAQGTFMARGGVTPEAANLLWKYKRMNAGRY